MKRSPLKRKASLAPSSAALTRSPLSPGAERRPSVQSRFKRGAVRQSATGRRCAFGRGHQGPFEAHHLIAKQELRRFARSLRLPPAEARALERRLISDPRNGLLLCWPCHRRFEAALLTIPRTMLPLEVFAFARELDAMAPGDAQPFMSRLERRYPR